MKDIVNYAQLSIAKIWFARHNARLQW